MPLARLMAEGAQVPHPPVGSTQTRAVAGRRGGPDDLTNTVDVGGGAVCTAESAEASHSPVGRPPEGLVRRPDGHARSDDLAEVVDGDPGSPDRRGCPGPAYPRSGSTGTHGHGFA